MATIGSLAIRVSALNEVARGLRGAERDVNRFASRVRGRVQSAVQVPPIAIGGFKGLAALGAAGGLMAGLRSVENFNQAMTDSLSIVNNVTPQIRQQMEQTAFQVAYQTKFSATEAAQAFKFLASAGLDAAQSMKALPAVARFAQAGNFDLERATELAVTAQSTMGMVSQDAAKNLANLTRVTDVLNMANNVATGSTEQFAAALNNKAGAAFRSVGKDIEEAVAMLAAFHQQGTQGEEAGTQLAILLRDLKTRAIENAQAFKAAGVNVFDASGDMQNFADILADLEEHLNGLSDKAEQSALLKLGFTDKSVGALQTVLGMSNQIRQFEAAMRNSTGQTAQQAMRAITPWQSGMAKLGAVVSVTARVLGGPLVTALAKMIDLAARFANVLVPVVIGLVAAKVAMVALAAATKAMAIVTAVATGARGVGGWVALGVGILAAGGAAVALNDALSNLGVSIDPEDMKTALADATTSMEDAMAAAGGLSGALNSIGGVGAVDRRSVEGFNNLQRSIQGMDGGPIDAVAAGLNGVADAANNAAQAVGNLNQAVANANNATGPLAAANAQFQQDMHNLMHDLAAAAQNPGTPMPNFRARMLDAARRLRSALNVPDAAPQQIHHALPQTLNRRMQLHLLRGDPLSDPLTMRDHLPASMRAGDRSFAGSERAVGELRELNKSVGGTLEVADTETQKVARQQLKVLETMERALRDGRTTTIDFV